MRRFTSVIAAILVYLATGSAGLAIESCTITEVTPLTFGTLQKPASGSQTFTIRANGLGPTGTGTLLYGTTSRGEYTLRRTGVGGGFTSVTIDIQNISSGDPNLTLSTFTGRYGLNPIASFPEAGLNPPRLSVQRFTSVQLRPITAR